MPYPNLVKGQKHFYDFFSLFFAFSISFFIIIRAQLQKKNIFSVIFEKATLF